MLIFYQQGKKKHLNEACQDIAHRVYSQLLDIVTMFRRTDTHMRAEACSDFTWLDSHIPLHHAEWELHPLGKSTVKSVQTQTQEWSSSR